MGISKCLGWVVRYGIALCLVAVIVVAAGQLGMKTGDTESGFLAPAVEAGHGEAGAAGHGEEGAAVHDDAGAAGHDEAGAEEKGEEHGDDAPDDQEQGEESHS